MILILFLLILISIVVLYLQQISRTFKYDVLEIRNLLSEEECQQLIHLAKESNMEESSVVEADAIYKSKPEFRKSLQCWKKPEDHPVLVKLSQLSVHLTGFPVSNQEKIQIVKYNKDGKFDAHYDACVDGDQLCKQMNRGSTERRTTLLVYLNDDMLGGETEFVNIGKIVKPETGKGILFWSTNEKDQLYTESKHKGNKVEEGEKWIATVWSHGSIFV